MYVGWPTMIRMLSLNLDRRGNFADSFGEDFLGLRELGIAAEFGLQSLTIPKKLLKGKKQGQAEGPSAYVSHLHAPFTYSYCLSNTSAKPTEPPPPFPPPPPFVPLDSKAVDNQIGLLRAFYHERLSTVSAQPPGAAAPPSSMPPGYPQPIPVSPDADTLAVLSDDVPSPVHTKIGPLGQIVKNAPSAAASKKKKAKAPAAPMGMGPAPSEGGEMLPDFAASASTPGLESPRKGQPSGGSTAKKKPGNGPAALPAAIMANA